tara:strand:- start:4548 stop:10052 length:5505 start_codon:yes stop_codon:yes gene_type:complete
MFETSLQCRATTNYKNEKNWRMIVQLEDFETQSNVDKAVVRSDNTKLVTLTDLVPTPPGTKGQEISKYLFEQPAYNQDWFNILFDSKAMARQEELKREYLEKIANGELFTEETLYAKVQGWSVYNDPDPQLKEFKKKYAEKPWVTRESQLILQTLVARGERAWSELTWSLYYNGMRYWPRVPQAVWTVTRGRLLHWIPRDRLTGQILWRQWTSEFTPAFAVAYRYKYFLETETRRFARQAFQFIDYRSAIATIALGSYVFGMVNYLHHYSQSEQERKLMFQGPRTFTPVLISKEAQENHARLIDEGIRAVYDSIQVDSPQAYGAYGENVERKVQYESEVQEQGTTKTLVFYKKHNVLRTTIPTEDLIHLKPFNRSKDKSFTETGGVPMKLRTPGVQPGQTRMPEFKIYGDNKFYVERTFDMNLRLDQPFAPREDDIQKFEETLQPEMEIIMGPDAFDHSYVEAHNLQVDTHTETIEDLYPKPLTLGMTRSETRPYPYSFKDRKKTRKRVAEPNEQLKAPIEDVIQNLTDFLEDPTFVENLDLTPVVKDPIKVDLSGLEDDEENNGTTFSEDSEDELDFETQETDSEENGNPLSMDDLESDYSLDEGQRDTSLRNYYSLMPTRWPAATTKPTKTAKTAFANADQSWARGGKTTPIAIEAKTQMAGLNTGLMNVKGWTLPTTQMTYPFLAVKDIAKMADPDLGQYKVHFEDIEKAPDETTRWYSRYEMDEETNEYFGEVDENHESDNDMTSEEDETEPEPNGTPTTETSNMLETETDDDETSDVEDDEDDDGELPEFETKIEESNGKVHSVDPVDSIELLEGDTLYDLDNDTENSVAELDMDVEIDEPHNPAVLKNTDVDEFLHHESKMGNNLDNTLENVENADETEDFEPGFASAYAQAKLNHADVASDPHFGDELTGLSHTEAKLFQTEANPETETRMFLHGTHEVHSRSLASTSWELEDNITNAFAKVHVRLIRFWQANALVVYPVIAIYLIRRTERYQAQVICRARAKNTETHKYYTHLGRAPQRAKFTDLTGNEGGTRQMRELMSAFRRVRGFTETYRPGILINFWEIDILPLIPRRVRAAFLPPNGEMYLWYKKQLTNVFGQTTNSQRALQGAVPVETFWNSAPIRGLYACEKEEPPFKTSLEVFETMDSLITTVTNGPNEQSGLNQKIGQYLYSQSHKNMDETISKIERYFPAVMPMVLKVQNFWDHTPLLAAIRPGKYSLDSLPRGLLLIGESGNGRTLMARALASESGLPIMLTEGMRFVHQKWGCFRLRSLFYRARLNYPCILYIKNLELITLHRSIFTGYFNVRNCAQFLVCFDGIVDRKKSTIRQPFIIGSVETSKYMDPACVRSGRFEWAIKFNLPNALQRYSLLTTALETNGRATKKDVSLPFFALTTFGYSAQEVAQMVGLSGFLAVTKYERKANYEHSNESFAEAVGSCNRLIMRHEDKYVHSTDIFEDGFYARLTAYEEKSNFPHRLSSTIKNDGFIPFETKWIHMVLENYEFSGQFEPKEGWPMTGSFSNARSPEEFEARRRSAYTLMYETLAPPKGSMSASDPAYINVVLSTQMTEMNPLPFTKETVYHADAATLVTWGIFDLLSEIAFFKQTNRKLQGTSEIILGMETCYDTYAHEFAEQLGDRFSPLGWDSQLERVQAGIDQVNPESRLMTHFRRLTQKNKETVGVGKSWVQVTQSGLSRIVESRGDLKRDRQREARFSLRNWSYRQEFALARRTLYWRERGQMRFHSSQYNMMNVTSIDHNQNSRLTRLYFRDMLIESRQKRALRVSIEPTIYDTFATRKLVVRARKPVAEASQLLAGDLLHVWFDWAKTYSNL